MASFKVLTLTELLLLAVVGCGGNVSRSHDENTSAPEPTSGEPSLGADPPGSEPSPNPVDSGSVTAEQLNDVWIFYHHNEGYSTARLSGIATVVDDCLRVRDTLVLWNAVDALAVKELVTSVQAGNSIRVTVGGGASEPGSAGYPILKSCSGGLVWFAAPGPQMRNE